MLSFSPYRGKKHRHGKGLRSRNCRLNMGTGCSVGFAVAIVYEKMLVCSRMGMRVAFASAIICVHEA